MPNWANYIIVLGTLLSWPKTCTGSAEFMVRCPRYCIPRLRGIAVKSRTAITVEIPKYKLPMYILYIGGKVLGVKTKRYYGVNNNKRIALSNP